ncbi:MAG TPA: MFS transporter [Galbitalea sp.]|nr:MFS transporter [Galbitalea sp.]
MTDTSTASSPVAAPPHAGARWLPATMLFAVGTFAIGTDSFVLAGILPELARGLRVSEGAAGQVVTAFAITYAIAAPFLSVLTQRLPRKALILIALALFTVGNIAGAFAPTLAVLLISRVLTALGAASFTPTANAAATTLAGPARRGRALSVVLGGIALGTVIGVPAGTAIGQQVGWQGSLLLVAALGIVALVAISIVLPHLNGDAQSPLRARFALMAQRRVLLVVGVTALATGSGIMVYTYIAPILDRTAHVTGSALAIFLLVWGVGGAVGAFGSGWMTERIGAGRTSALSIALLALALLGIAFIPNGAVVLAFAVVGGIGSWGFVAPDNHMLTGMHPKTASVVIAFNSTGTYVGQAVGAAVGGSLIVSGLAAALICVIGAAGLLVAAVLALVASRVTRLV